MKTSSLFITLSLLLFISILTYAKEPASKTSFKVNGSCDMCKERIEIAAKAKGVKSIDWNIDTHIATLVFYSSKISLDQILQNIARAGYDTDKYKASDSAYHELPKCCQYERKTD